jgi:AraC-like DNA-binding protein
MKLFVEHVQLQSGSSFACLDFNLPAFDHHYHHHPEIEITCILESSGQRLIGDSLAPFVPGDLVLIGSNLPHLYRNWQSGRARSRVIQFKRECFGPEFFGLTEFGRINRLLDDAARGINFSPSIRLAARRKMATLSKTTPGPMRIVRLLELLQILSKDPNSQKIASGAYTKPVNVKKIERLQRVLNYLENHWRQTVTLEEVARVAAFHPQSMSRFFHQHLGMTFQDYLIQLRISRAAQMLLETERTVAAVAFDCGFNNLANFNRHFLNIRGRTPSRYRQECQKIDGGFGN